MSSFGVETRRVRTDLSHGAILVAAGRTDPGVRREVNEDRFHVDEGRGLLVVIDGVGGQAAGGKAADVALAMVRERLERETGPVADRIREAITIANNEIHRLASLRPEWNGMACVLTVAVVKEDTATIGHVGDTRLYKIRGGRIEKVTRDHSPVGEREDARELSEQEAMRHPRRNEVYRDVGSDPHVVADRDFIDIHEIRFEEDAALLLCTDGLTDLVDSATIVRTIGELAGNPPAVAGALIDAANAAGGTDNVTAVYAEGERFAETQWAIHRTMREGRSATVRSNGGAAPGLADTRPNAPRSRRRLIVRVSLLVLTLMVAAMAVWRQWLPTSSWLPPGWLDRSPASETIADPAPAVRIVQPDESIAEALDEATAGSQILVEPGEYREQLVLKDRVRVVSRVPRGASIRLPAATPDAAGVPAVVAHGVSGAELVGFRIVGDAATPLTVGISIQDSAVAVLDVEITGARATGVDVRGEGTMIVGGDFHDNPGTALIVRAGAAPRITHSSFARNGTSERTRSALVIERGAAPLFQRNVFVGLTPAAFAALDDAARRVLRGENWFVPASDPRSGRPPAAGQRSRIR